MPGGNPRGGGGGSQARRHIPKRAQNPRRKECREACWKRGEKRKERNRRAQDARTKNNKSGRAFGRKTPWEEAKAKRYARRHPGAEVTTSS